MTVGRPLTEAGRVHRPPFDAPGVERAEQAQFTEGFQAADAVRVRLQSRYIGDLDEVSYPGRGLFWLGCPGGKILLSIY